MQTCRKKKKRWRNIMISTISLKLQVLSGLSQHQCEFYISYRIFSIVCLHYDMIKIQMVCIGRKPRQLHTMHSGWAKKEELWCWNLDMSFVSFNHIQSENTMQKHSIWYLKSSRSFPLFQTYTVSYTLFVCKNERRSKKAIYCCKSVECMELLPKVFFIHSLALNFPSSNCVCTKSLEKKKKKIFHICDWWFKS